MMNRSSLFAVSLTTVLGFACGGEARLLDTPSPGKITEPTAKVEPSAFLNGCELEHWSAASNTYGINPEAPQFSPNGGLVTRPSAVYRTGTEYFRRSDGSPAGTLVSSPISRSRDWDWTVRYADPALGDEGLVLERRSDGLQHILLARSGDIHIPQAILTPDGSRLVVFRIRQSGGVLRIYDSLTMALEHEIDLAQFESVEWRDSHRLVPLDRDRAFILTDVGVAAIELDSGVIGASTRLIEEASAAEMEQVISAAVDPAGERLAVSTADNEVHILATGDLSPVREPLRSTHVIANQGIFAPHIAASPVAWSPDGVALAYLDPAGNVAVRDLSNDTLVWSADAVEPAVGFGASSALGLGFAPKGSGIALVYQSHTEAFDCVGTRPDLLGELTFTVSGPEEVSPNELVPLELIVEDGGDFLVAQVTGSEDQFAPASTSQRILWPPWSEGPVTLRIQVDDGLRRGVAEHTITVVPRD